MHLQVRLSPDLVSALAELRGAHSAAQVVFVDHIASVRQELESVRLAHQFSELSRLSVAAASGGEARDPIDRARGALRFAARPAAELRALARSDA
jgi:hypothetical protein